MSFPILSICSSRNRSRRPQSKQGRQSLLGLSKSQLVGCAIAMCCAGVAGYWHITEQPAYLNETKANAVRLQTALDEALGTDKQRGALASATRFLRPSFDALLKDAHGNVNAQAAKHLLHNYFSNLGWHVDGLESHSMQNTTHKGLREALNHVAILEHGFAAVGGSLQMMARAGTGLSFHHVVGLAALVRSKLAGPSHAGRLLRMMYRRNNLTYGKDIDQNSLQQVIHEYVANLNAVDNGVSDNASELALQNVDVLQSLKASTLQHLLSTRKSQKGVPQNFSTDQIVRAAENLTHSFEKLYIVNHCHPLTKQLVAAAPKETGRMRLSTFYNQMWNGSQNFAEPTKRLDEAGALDGSNSKVPKVLIANYIHGHLNCIRRSEHYSLCCPNQCIALMQEIESSVLSPASTPEKLLQTITQLTTPTMSHQEKLPQALVSKLHEVAARHGGVVPLHGRLFAQWLHYVFPNECSYPTQAARATRHTRKGRLTASDITKEEKEQVEWGKLNVGFDEPATALHSAPWNAEEVLPLQVDQVWRASSYSWRDATRAVTVAAALIALLLMIIGQIPSSLGTTDASAIDAQKSARNQEFEERVQKKLNMLRFEFSVEVMRCKGQQDMKMGLQLKTAYDAVGGIMVEDITPDGLIYFKNKTSADSKNVVVVAGDRLISVNGESEEKAMMLELSKLSVAKQMLRFSRESSKAAPLTWTATVQRTDDEPWGMSISRGDGVSETSRELTISRIIAGGPVHKWNQKAARKNLHGIYPGDIIMACEPELATSKILGKLQKEGSLELTLLRWQGASKDEARPAPKIKDAVVSVESAADNIVGALQESRFQQQPESKVEQHKCECCGSSISDKYVLMCCNAGDVKYFRRTCWRQQHGGFTTKHMPRHCPCGSPLAKLEVYERGSHDSEARLVHTILDGPMEVDIAFEEAPDNEERPGGLNRRAASATRRAIEGDARRRAASAGRRVRPAANEEEKLHQDQAQLAGAAASTAAVPALLEPSCNVEAHMQVPARPDAAPQRCEKVQREENANVTTKAARSCLRTRAESHNSAEQDLQTRSADVVRVAVSAEVKLEKGEDLWFSEPNADPWANASRRSCSGRSPPRITAAAAADSGAQRSMWGEAAACQPPPPLSQASAPAEAGRELPSEPINHFGPPGLEGLASPINHFRPPPGLEGLASPPGLNPGPPPGLQLSALPPPPGLGRRWGRGE